MGIYDQEIVTVKQDLGHSGDLSVKRDDRRGLTAITYGSISQPPFPVAKLKTLCLRSNNTKLR